MSGGSNEPATRRLSAPGVVLIDAQPGFLRRFGGMATPAEVDERWVKLLVLCRHLRLPVVATFEEPASNGWLSEPCEQAWPAHGTRFAKETFDCMAQPDIRAAVESMGSPQVLVGGTETDVCVLQSVLSMLAAGLQVFLLEDCTVSSEPHTRPALERMYRAGAIPCTLKSAYYELMKTAAIAYRPVDAAPEWRALVEEFGRPEELRPWTPAR